MKRSPVLCVRDILEAMNNARVFVEGMELSEFSSDLKTVMAVERMITIIGEAARNVPDDTRDRFPTIPWSDMVGMRNFISHVYFRVNQETVWKTVTVVIPELLPAISRCLDVLQRDEPD